MHALPFAFYQHQQETNPIESISPPLHNNENTTTVNECLTTRPSNRALSPVNSPTRRNRNDPIIPAGTNRSFTFYYQNVRGLRTKTNDLFLSLSQCDYDIIAFTETWLHSGIQNSELTNNYRIYRCDRNEQTSRHARGGGVMIAVKSDLQSTAVCISGCDQLEQIIVRVVVPNFDIIVCSIYLPPNSELIRYEQHALCVQKLIDLAGDRNVVLVVGDYNLPLLRWTHDETVNCLLPVNASSEQEIALVESIVSKGLHQINDLTNFNGRLLDLAFISVNRCVEVLEPPLPLLSIDNHHRPFLILFELADEE